MESKKASEKGSSSEKGKGVCCICLKLGKNNQEEEITFLENKFHSLKQFPCCKNYYCDSCEKKDVNLTQCPHCLKGSEGKSTSLETPPISTTFEEEKLNDEILKFCVVCSQSFYTLDDDIGDFHRIKHFNIFKQETCPGVMYCTECSYALISQEENSGKIPSCPLCKCLYIQLKKNQEEIPSLSFKEVKEIFSLPLNNEKKAFVLSVEDEAITKVQSPKAVATEPTIILAIKDEEVRRVQIPMTDVLSIKDDEVPKTSSPMSTSISSTIAQASDVANSSSIAVKNKDEAEVDEYSMKKKGTCCLCLESNLEEEQNEENLSFPLVKHFNFLIKLNCCGAYCCQFCSDNICAASDLSWNCPLCKTSPNVDVDFRKGYALDELKDTDKENISVNSQEHRYECSICLEKHLLGQSNPSKSNHGSIHGLFIVKYFNYVQIHPCGLYFCQNCLESNRKKERETGIMFSCSKCETIADNALVEDVKLFSDPWLKGNKYEFKGEVYILESYDLSKGSSILLKEDGSCFVVGVTLENLTECPIEIPLKTPPLLPHNHVLVFTDEVDFSNSSENPFFSDKSRIVEAKVEEILEEILPRPLSPPPPSSPSPPPLQTNVVEESVEVQIIDEAEKILFDTYSVLADKGDAKFQFKVGIMYFKGEGVIKSKEEAFKYIKLSADQGFTNALVTLGRGHLEGEGFDKSTEIGLEYLKIAGQKVGWQSIFCCNDLGSIYFKGLHGIEKSIEKGLEWFTSAANKGSIRALNQLGMIYLKGAEGVQISEEKAFKYFMKSAELGSTLGELHLISCYFDGLGVEKSEEKSFELTFQLTTEKKVKEAENQLGFFYAMGIGVKKSRVQAIFWFSKYLKGNKGVSTQAAKDKLEETKRIQSQECSFCEKKAPVRLSLQCGKCFSVYYCNRSCQIKHWKTHKVECQALYPDKDSTKLDSEELALDSRKKIFEQLLNSCDNDGDAESLFKVGAMYAEGDGVTKSINLALKYVQMAADKNHPAAICLLGDFFLAGIGVEKNPRKSLELFKIAAEKESPDALIIIGQFYLEGVMGLVEKSYATAVNYFKKAIHLGSADGLLSLGICHQNGLGVEKSIFSAFHYFSSAAKKGSKLGAYYAGTLLAEGLGCEQSIFKAIYWLSKFMDDNSDRNELYDDASELLEELKIIKFQFCAACGEIDASLVFKCEKCSFVHYCNLECKKKHWEAGHKIECETFFPAKDETNDNEALVMDEGQSIEFKEYLKLADGGDAENQYIVGLMYLAGDGVLQSNGKAFEYFEFSANQGFNKGQYYLGDCYFKGIGVEKSSLTALELFKVASQNGNAESKNFLAMMYLNGGLGSLEGLDNDQSNDMVFSLLHQAAEQGLPVAQSNLSNCYYSGIGVEKSLEQAYNWSMKAALQGFKKSQKTVALFFATDTNVVVKSYVKAIYWFVEFLKDNFDADLCDEVKKVLSMLLNIQTEICGSCGSKEGNISQKCGSCLSINYCSLECQKVHWKNGHKAECTVVDKKIIKSLQCESLFFPKPNPVEPKSKEEVESPPTTSIKDKMPPVLDFNYHLKLADLGDSNSQFLFTKMYFSGQGVSKSDHSSFIYLKKAADQGHKKAMFVLAQQYLSGENVVEKSTEKALEYLKLSSDDGFDESSFFLGRIYKEGRYGVNESESTAFKYFLLSAEQNNAQGQFLVSQYFASGGAGEKSFDKAFQWLSLAATNGFKSAQYDLALIYEKGLIDVRKSNVKAIYWLIESLKVNEDENKVLSAINKLITLVKIQNEMCSFCDKPYGNIPIIHCNRCYSVCYCSDECETKDLNYRHRDECQIINYEDIKSYIPQTSGPSTGTPHLDFRDLLLKTVAGDAEAQFQLALLYFKGSDGGLAAKSQKNAFKYFKKAADQGHGEAQYYAADILFSQGQKDESLRYLKLAADQDVDRAQLKLGVFYLQGVLGAEKSALKGLEYLKLAASKDNDIGLRASLNLASFFLKCIDVEKSYEQSMYYFKHAAERGSIEAQEHVGLSYFQGDNGFEKSLDLAFEWLLKAAENESKKSQYYVAYFYVNEIGVKESVVKSIYWLLRCLKENEDKELTEKAKTKLSELINFTKSKCSSCEELLGESKLKCGRCFSACYCSLECQKKHWKIGHKAECQSNDLEELKSCIAL